MEGWLTQLVAESNRIEGINHTSFADVEAHQKFFALPRIEVENLQDFVFRVQPDGRLRDIVGRDVRVGNHVPPLGHANMRSWVQEIINQVNHKSLTPWQAHCKYEDLHPFTDGNGRSGRVLWAWHMIHIGRKASLEQLGFLHNFYYQTLEARRHV